MGGTSPTGGNWIPPSVEHLQSLLPQYEISRLLGHGGMGAVYEGVQSNLDRKVAIKILPETLGEDTEGLNFSERFKLEAKSMANLDHPGIISVYDFGQTSEGQLYFVMEFIDGMDIHQYLQHEGGKLPPEHAIAIVAHVLDALGYAHDLGIVHRDIKPANIMIKSDGRVKLADFGLVKRLSETGEGSPDSGSLTMTNVAIGTPDFVAPECLEIGRTVDHRADLYAIGVMFYQLLTGAVPRGNFRAPSGRIEGLDPRLDVIVSRAMESDPDHRYQTAAEFRAAIDEILTSPIAEDTHTGPVSPSEQMLVTGGPTGRSAQVGTRGGASPVAGGKKKGKRPALIAASVGICLAVIVGAALFRPDGGDGDDHKANGKQGVDVAKVSQPKAGKKSKRGKITPAKANPKPETPPKPEPEPKVVPIPTTPDPTVPDPTPATPKTEPEPTTPEPIPDPAPTPDDPVAKRLAEIDGQYQEFFEKPYTDALAMLNQQFSGALNREEQAASQTGDLDLVLAFQNEAKQIGNGQGAGPADAADAPPKLKQWRTTWHTQHQKLLGEQAANRKEAHARRDRALDSYQQERVKAQDIAAAQRVKALREQLAANPEAGAAATAIAGVPPVSVTPPPYLKPPTPRPAGESIVAEIPDPKNLPYPDGKAADMSQPVQVFVLLGDQSMFGAGRVNGTGPGSLNVAVKRGAYPFLVDPDGNWTTRKDVRNVFVSENLGEQKNDWLTASDSERIGPEIGFGAFIGEAIDAPVLIIKACNGNRSLGWDLLPPGSEQYEHQGKIYAGYKESPSSWNKGSKPKPIDWYAGRQYDEDVASAKMVLENLGKYYPGAREYEIAGFVFWQGVKDRNDAGHVERYELNLVNLIQSLRKDFEAPGAKFVCATMGNVKKETGGADGKIRAAQLAVDGKTGQYEAFEGNVATVFTHPLSKGGTPRDGYKQIAETFMDVGLALGSAMAELLKNATPER